LKNLSLSLRAIYGFGVAHIWAESRNRGRIWEEEFLNRQDAKKEGRGMDKAVKDILRVYRC
jgi:hypothetical protein